MEDSHDTVGEGAGKEEEEEEWVHRFP